MTRDHLPQRDALQLDSPHSGGLWQSGL